MNSERTGYHSCKELCASLFFPMSRKTGEMEVSTDFFFSYCHDAWVSIFLFLFLFLQLMCPQYHPSAKEWCSVKLQIERAAFCCSHEGKVKEPVFGSGFYSPPFCVQRNAVLLGLQDKRNQSLVFQHILTCILFVKWVHCHGSNRTSIF